MADVTIDGSINTATARGMRSVVFTSATDGYFFYADTGAAGLKYSKTTDGGATWGAGVLVSAAIAPVAYDVWFDQWTPGDSGTLIHIWYFDVTGDDVLYRTLDTSSDTLGTVRTVFAGATSVAGRGCFVSGTKTRSGYLYCAYDIDAGAEKGLHRSTDGGPTWSASLATTFVEATIDQCFLFPATGTGDNNDCWALYQDASADAVTLKMWDSSAAAQVESATIAAQGESPTDLNGQYGFSASVRHSDGHLLMASRVAGLGAAGAFEFYDIASTSSWTKKTNIDAVNHDDNWYPSTFIDQATGDIYLAYIGALDGSEAVGTTAAVHYVKSTDGGTTWGAEQAYQQSADNAVRQTWAPLMGPRFYVGSRVGTTLIGNAVNSLSFSSGSTFNDSVTESVTVAESETSLAAFAGVRSESGTVADTETATASMGVARSEALTAADSETGGQTSSASRAEAVTAADSETGGVGFAAARSESVTASDGSTGNTTLPVTQAESLSVADSETGTTTTGPQTFNVTASDVLTVADSEVGPAVYPVSRAESGSASDGMSSTAFFAALREEMLATGDLPDATANQFVGRGEMLSALDVQTGEIAPTGAEFTFSLDGGTVMTLSIVAGNVLTASVSGGPILTGSVSGGEI